MRTLNVRLAAICCVVVVLLGGGMHLLHGFQVHRKAGGLKDASLRAEEEKDLREAIRLLENYVALVPKDRKEQLHLGLLYATQPNATSPPFNARQHLSNSKNSCVLPRAPCPGMNWMRLGGSSSTWRY